MDYATLRNLMKNKEKLDAITNQTQFLDHFYPSVCLRQRVWHIDNNVFECQQCQTCNNKLVKWNNKSGEYRRFCGSKCAHQSDVVKTKTKETCIGRYGVATNLQTAATKRKIKDTLMARYGVDNPSKSAAVQAKIKDTFLQKYGVDNPSKVDSVKEKVDATHYARYGRKRSSQKHIPTNIIELKNNRDIMYDWHVTRKMPIQEIAEVLNVNHSQLCYHFKQNLNIPIRKRFVSSIEKEIYDLVLAHGIRVVASDRTVICPKEIDLYFPDHNFGIEIDGLAWHTELRGKNKSYHLNKTQECKKKGIFLIHITDHEWNTKKEIVKYRILSKLGVNNRLYARQCNIVPVSRKESEVFFNGNHIQGYCTDKVSYGLQYQGQLVAMMSFGKARFNKQFQWELLRFANSKHLNVVGAASKLFSHFVKVHDPDSIISYSDNRWNQGTVYAKLGFSFVKDSDPNYWYSKNSRTFESRLRYQKHKLPSLIENFNPAVTEWDNMVLAGFDRYWDCGNAIYHWRKLSPVKPQLGFS